MAVEEDKMANQANVKAQIATEGFMIMMCSWLEEKWRTERERKKKPML